MRVHVLRPDSVTPIATYLALSSASPRAFPPQLDLALALLYREREYSVMCWSTLTAPDTSANAFLPYGLTLQARQDHAVMTGRTLTSSASPELRPLDPFGVKSEVAARLSGALRTVKSHRWGWVLKAQLAADLCRWRDAVEAARQASDLGTSRPGLALAYAAAVAGATDVANRPYSPQRVTSGQGLAIALRSRARREGMEVRPGWDQRQLRGWDDWLQRAGLRVRRRVEGRAFERFVTTEAAFCDDERQRALESFAIDRVPRELRSLEDLAQSLGLGDDPCRGVFIRRMSLAARRSALTRIRAGESAIQAWLSTLAPPYEAEAAAYYWLLAAAEELEAAV